VAVTCVCDDAPMVTHALTRFRPDIKLYGSSSKMFAAAQLDMVLVAPPPHARGSYANCLNSKFWKAHGLKPHLIKGFRLSNDPHFEAKLVDVVGLAGGLTQMFGSVGIGRSADWDEGDHGETLSMGTHRSMLPGPAHQVIRLAVIVKVGDFFCKCR